MLEDELKKLGLRVRPRTTSRPAEAQPGKPGHIAFDDRGNAIYEWDADYLSEDSEAAERARRRALSHPGLSLVDDEPEANAPIRNNTKGARLGYNPYESGLLSRKEDKRTRDLRELSKWIELKKQLDKKRSED